MGFATYFIGNLNHEVAESGMSTKPAGGWSMRARRRAHRPDRRLAAGPAGCARDRFLVAGSAWQACREGEADPARFLVDPGLDIEDTRGWPYLRHNLVHDLAALNKVEMLLGDGWGLIERERPSEQELQLLDHLAQVTLSGDAAFDELRRLYNSEPGLQVPSAVTSYSPAAEAPGTVMLDASP